MHGYADLLDHLADTIALYAEPGPSHAALQQHIDEDRSRHRRLAEGPGAQPLSGPDSWPVYGSLLVDVQRVLDELWQHVRSEDADRASDSRVWRYAARVSRG